MEEALQAEEGICNLGGGQHSTCEDARAKDTEGRGTSPRRSAKLRPGPGALHGALNVTHFNPDLMSEPGPGNGAGGQRGHAPCRNGAGSDVRVAGRDGM